MAYTMAGSRRSRAGRYRPRAVPTAFLGSSRNSRDEEIDMMTVGRRG